MAKEYQY